MDYSSFLSNKLIMDRPAGFEPSKLSSRLFDFQRDIVQWGLRRGKAAFFEECGLGKTLQQLEWMQQVCNDGVFDGTGLILAPLAVADQTKREGEKFGYDVNICESQADVRSGINITNYEKLHKFEPHKFDAVALDESSILKSYDGKFRNLLIESFRNTPYKSCWTATPAPNDYMELGNHAEFLGIMSRTEMLATFFVHDGGDTSKWRLKGHAQEDFWRWVCSWAVNIKKPSDLGYDDGNFILPALHINECVVDCEAKQVGMLFAMPASTLQERRAARRGSLDARVKYTADNVNRNNDSCVIWCDLNDESAQLTKLINGAVEIKGSDSNEHKVKAMLGFADGSINRLVTKPSICG